MPPMTTFKCQEANIEPINDNSNSATEEPVMDNDAGVLGPLRSETAMSLHTREAHTLFAGRPQEGGKASRKNYSTNNLKKFAVKINAIWFAAQGDDPFADWFLCLIEQQMKEAGFLMAAEIAGLQGLLDRPGLLKPQSTHSTEPVEIQLNFANPFSYRAALLIAQYDKLALMALAAAIPAKMERKPRMSISMPGQAHQEAVHDGGQMETQRGHAGQLRSRHCRHPESGSGHGQTTQSRP